jgi:hypothetical protein
MSQVVRSARESGLKALATSQSAGETSWTTADFSPHLSLSGHAFKPALGTASHSC